MKVQIDLDRIEEMLKSTPLTTVSQISDVSANTLYRYRRGQGDLLNMTLQVAIALQRTVEVLDAADDSKIKLPGIRKVVGQINAINAPAVIAIDDDNRLSVHDVNNVPEQLATIITRLPAGEKLTMFTVRQTVLQYLKSAKE